MHDASVKSHAELRNLTWNDVLLFRNIGYFEHMISNVLEYLLMAIILKNQIKYQFHFRQFSTIAEMDENMT